jgi:hypothetical protein
MLLYFHVTDLSHYYPMYEIGHDVFTSGLGDDKLVIAI